MVKQFFLWNKYILLDSIHHFANILHSASERLSEDTFCLVDAAEDAFLDAGGDESKIQSYINKCILKYRRRHIRKQMKFVSRENRKLEREGADYRAYAREILDDNGDVVRIIIDYVDAQQINSLPFSVYDK